jgi:hypothetical protein
MMRGHRLGHSDNASWPENFTRQYCNITAGLTLICIATGTRTGSCQVHVPSSQSIRRSPISWWPKHARNHYVRAYSTMYWCQNMTLHNIQYSSFKPWKKAQAVVLRVDWLIANSSHNAVSVYHPGRCLPQCRPSSLSIDTKFMAWLGEINCWFKFFV